LLLTGYVKNIHATIENLDDQQKRRKKRACSFSGSLLNRIWQKVAHSKAERGYQQEATNEKNYKATLGLFFLSHCRCTQSDSTTLLGFIEALFARAEFGRSHAHKLQPTLQLRRPPQVWIASGTLA
jgi:hypothetical protein